MKLETVATICRVLIVSMLLLSFQQVQAGMIGTDQLISAGSAQSDRNTVLSTVQRSEVANQLQALGLDPATAKDRVATMTDEEVRTLAGKLEALPAGAASGWAIAAAVIIIAAIVYFVWK